MARKKNIDKELYWGDVVERQAKSGLSIRQFCAKEGVSEYSFYAWRRKLRERLKDATRAGTPKRDVEEFATGRDFIPLQLFQADDAMEVIHPLGYRVRITGEVNGTALQRVLDILDGRRTG